MTCLQLDDEERDQRDLWRFFLSGSDSEESERFSVFLGLATLASLASSSGFVLALASACRRESQSSC